MLRSDQRRHKNIRLTLMLVLVNPVVMTCGVRAQSGESGPDHAITASQPAPTPDAQILGRTLRNVLYVLLVLVGVFVVSSYAFIRWSRRYKRWLLRQPGQPTPHEDVWSMHKLSAENGEEQDAEPHEGNDR